MPNDTAPDYDIRPWPRDRDAEIAPVLADATFAGTAESAQERIDAARAGGPDRVYALVREGAVIAAYTLVRDGMANQVDIMAVAPEFRRQGFGRAILKDALARSGRRPLVVETDDETLGFYKTCGFKMVGRRKHPTGYVRYRLGWHAPAAKPDGTTC